MEILFKKLHPDAKIPEIASELAGGWDVTAVNIEFKGPNYVICHLGFALSLPKAHKLTIVPRSNITKTQWFMQNSPGLGDEDYTGPYQMRFRCIPTITSDGKLEYEPFPYKVGDRVGQVYLETVIPIEFKTVEELPETKRGDGGFGSTNNQSKL